ncbi:PREDICTED: uncharacterized protein LOC106906943 [Poecilia mexicana]|uniref:uncharacterized protein LOC106906943 n=1 Tax=Poecilia mexicana TaxID=48701 RepID=UPI00072DD26F|nr:PREDICTED: uncharacterized protein LOC106906943 [Poecilia mexicana]
MAKLEIFLLFVLQLEGISGDASNVYHTVGDDVVLPCVGPSSSSCRSVIWLYNDIVHSPTKSKVSDGNINQKSVNAARLSLNTDCSLAIKSIIPEDAGRYTCRRGNTDSEVHLNILSISPSQPAGDAAKDGNINLQCSLWKYFTRCLNNRFVWINDVGTELVGKNVSDQKTSAQIQCVSSLTVKPLDNRYTCQFFEGNTMKIEAHYTVLSTGPPASSPLSFIMLTLNITALILMVGLTVGIIRTRGRKKPQKDIKVRFAADDDTVDYENDGERSAAAALH